MTWSPVCQAMPMLPVIESCRSADGDRLRETGQQPVRDLGGPSWRIQTPHRDGELIATKARDGIVPANHCP